MSGSHDSYSIYPYNSLERIISEIYRDRKLIVVYIYRQILAFVAPYIG